MPTVERLVRLALLVQLFVATTALAAAVDEPSADREAALLHRHIELSGVKQWSRLASTWQPLTVPPATVYVVNLWSIQCKPCIAEFPHLKNVLAGWRSKPEVQFLFIADPPGETSESEAVAFWRKSIAALPDTDPCRSTSEDLRRILDDGAAPITLLLDEDFVVRQAFIGAINSRPLGRSIERLLRMAKDHAKDNDGPGKRRRGIASRRE